MTLSHCAPRSKPKVLDAERELAERLGHRLLRPLISAVLDGRNSATAAELISAGRLWRKRRSVQYAAVALTIDSLRESGFLPPDFAVTE